MNILLVGYGKMGKMVERIAQERNHVIIGKVTSEQGESLHNTDFKGVDMVIEFTQPTVAYHNIRYCLEKRVPIVCGTTGWTDKMPEVRRFCDETKGAFFYASNFSIGFNMMMLVNERLAKLMNKYPEYDVIIDETHHIYKKDKPSGTAITLADGVIAGLDRKDNWMLNEAQDKNDLVIHAHREGEVIGKHTVTYTSLLDKISLEHDAFDRRAFGLGAVLAAEWLKGRIGVYGMREMFKIFD